MRVIRRYNIHSTIHTIDSMRKAGEPRWGKSLRAKNIGDLDLSKTRNNRVNRRRDNEDTSFCDFLIF